jgi:hypothetical protein
MQPRGRRLLSSSSSGALSLPLNEPPAKRSGSVPKIAGLLRHGNGGTRERRFDEARDNALSIVRRWPKDVKALSLLASAKMAEDRVLGLFFRMIATCMRLEQTWLGKLLILVILVACFAVGRGLADAHAGHGARTDGRLCAHAAPCRVSARLSHSSRVVASEAQSEASRGFLNGT